MPRGPDDAAIEAQFAGEQVTTVEPEGEPPPRPEGGKPLLRLLELLGSIGYADAAAEAIDLAVGPESRDEYRARLEAYAALPPAALADGGGGGSSSGAKARKSADEGAVATSAEDLAQAHLDAAEQLGPPTPTGPQWQSLGPWTIPNGQTYGASRVNVSGRIAAIAVDPSNPAHVLAGAANGGVWESFDRGGSWAPRTDYAATLTVGAIAFDRTNPRTVYCGLGEGNWWFFLGAGILRSSDGGASWSTLCTAPFVGQGFYDLAVDPSDGTRLYAATTGGLYVSSDGGVTWTQRRAVRTYSIQITPPGGGGAEVLAACADGLWRSMNRGNNWNTVALPGAPANGFNRIAVAIAPSDPTVAYAWAAGQNPATPYLWRRAGGNWTLQPTVPGVNTNQSWYDWFVGVSPDNANQVYCGAISVHRGDLAGTTWTWRDIASKPSGDSIHPDSHAIAFEPGNANTIYVGNDGGLFRSPDRGITWQHCNNGLVITEFEYIAQNYGSSRWLIGGTQDNGTERWTGSQVWDHVADGDGGDCGVNRTTPSTVFHTFFGMSPQVSTSSGDPPWANIFPPLPPGEAQPFYPPFECSSTNGDTIAIGGAALYVSRNSGGAWTRVAFPSNGTAAALYVPTADVVYVGLFDGRILRTTWDGASWGALTALTTPRAAAVSDIVVDPNNASRIWVTYGQLWIAGTGRVYRSDDAGTTWTDCTAGLPNVAINAIEVDPWNGNRAWVGAALGVYETTNAGASWAPFAASLPNAWVGDLVFHPHARVLRAGTRNRGVWQIPVDGWITQPICGRQWSGTLSPNQTQLWFTWGWPATWHVFWTIMPTTPQVGVPAVTWNVQMERASAEYVTYWITVQNVSGANVNFDGRFCILSRY
ncbi:MAG TPA: hypothetical protein VF101_09855 [Gaiellaceae bacterium]